MLCAPEGTACTLSLLGRLVSLPTFGLHLEPHARLEGTGIDLTTEVAQVAQGIVHGLGTLAFGSQPPFELIEYGLATAVRVARVSLRDVREADALYLANSLIGLVRVERYESIAYQPDVATHQVVAEARRFCHRTEAWGPPHE